MDDSILNRPMKFWELISVFGRGNPKFEKLLNSKRWRNPYGEFYQQIDEFVTGRHHDILDSYVPLELSRACAKLGGDLNFFINSSRTIICSQRLTPSDVKISALEIHDQFGGAVIEEVLEKGSFEIPTKDNISASTPKS